MKQLPGPCVSVLLQQEHEVSHVVQKNWIGKMLGPRTSPRNSKVQPIGNLQSFSRKECYHSKTNVLIKIGLCCHQRVEMTVFLPSSIKKSSSKKTTALGEVGFSFVQLLHPVQCTA